MPALKNPFKRHRFPKEVILQAVRWYCRFALSYRDVRDLLEERGVHVDAATIYRWVRKSGLKSPNAPSSTSPAAA